MNKHNEKLKSKNINYVAIEKDGARYFHYKCPSGHKFRADRYRVLNGEAKCPSCNTHLGLRKTAESYDLELAQIESPLYPIEPFVNTTTKIRHACVEGHEHVVAPVHVLKGGGCPTCNGMKRRTPKEYEQELKDKLIYYKPVEPFKTVSSKLKHECPDCGNIWAAQPAEILKGSGCPSCAKQGFNPNRAAWIYYVKLWDAAHTYYKIGITNGDVDRRLRPLGKQYKILMKKQYENGYEAQAAEKLILETYRDCRIYAPQFIQNGYTELFRDDILLLDF